MMMNLWWWFTTTVWLATLNLMPQHVCCMSVFDQLLTTRLVSQNERYDDRAYRTLIPKGMSPGVRRRINSVIDTDNRRITQHERQVTSIDSNLVTHIITTQKRTVKNLTPQQVEFYRVANVTMDVSVGDADAVVRAVGAHNHSTGNITQHHSVKVPHAPNSLKNQMTRQFVMSDPFLRQMVLLMDRWSTVEPQKVGKFFGFRCSQFVDEMFVELLRGEFKDVSVEQRPYDRWLFNVRLTLVSMLQKATNPFVDVKKCGPNGSAPKKNTAKKKKQTVRKHIVQHKSRSGEIRRHRRFDPMKQLPKSVQSMFVRVKEKAIAWQCYQHFENQLMAQLLAKQKAEAAQKAKELEEKLEEEKIENMKKSRKASSFVDIGSSTGSIGFVETGERVGVPLRNETKYLETVLKDSWIKTFYLNTMIAWTSDAINKKATLAGEMYKTFKELVIKNQRESADLVVKPSTPTQELARRIRILVVHEIVSVLFDRSYVPDVAYQKHLLPFQFYQRYVYLLRFVGSWFVNAHTTAKKKEETKIEVKIRKSLLQIASLNVDNMNYTSATSILRDMMGLSLNSTVQYVAGQLWSSRNFTEALNPFRLSMSISATLLGVPYVSARYEHFRALYQADHWRVYSKAVGVVRKWFKLYSVAFDMTPTSQRTKQPHDGIADSCPYRSSLTRTEITNDNILKNLKMNATMLAEKGEDAMEFLTKSGAAYATCDYFTKQTNTSTPGFRMQQYVAASRTYAPMVFKYMNYILTDSVKKWMLVANGTILNPRKKLAVRLRLSYVADFMNRLVGFNSSGVLFSSRCAFGSSGSAAERLVNVTLRWRKALRLVDRRNGTCRQVAHVNDAALIQLFQSLVLLNSTKAEDLTIQLVLKTFHQQRVSLWHTIMSSGKFKKYSKQVIYLQMIISLTSAATKRARIPWVVDRWVARLPTLLRELFHAVYAKLSAGKVRAVNEFLEVPRLSSEQLSQHPWYVFLTSKNAQNQSNIIGESFRLSNMAGAYAFNRTRHFMFGGYTMVYAHLTSDGMNGSILEDHVDLSIINDMQSSALEAFWVTPYGLLNGLPKRFLITYRMYMKTVTAMHTT